MATDKIPNKIIYHIEWISVLVTVIGGIYFNIQTAHALTCRMDTMTSEMHQISTKQAERTDRLYEMFIDLLKENKAGDK